MIMKDYSQPPADLEAFYAAGGFVTAAVEGHGSMKIVTVYLPADMPPADLAVMRRRLQAAQEVRREQARQVAESLKGLCPVVVGTTHPVPIPDEPITVVEVPDDFDIIRCMQPVLPGTGFCPAHQDHQGGNDDTATQ